MSWSFTPLPPVCAGDGEMLADLQYHDDAPHRRTVDIAHHKSAIRSGDRAALLLIASLWLILAETRR
jgi:hypothetical protein